MMNQAETVLKTTHRILLRKKTAHLKIMHPMVTRMQTRKIIPGILQVIPPAILPAILLVETRNRKGKS